MMRPAVAAIFQQPCCCCFVPLPPGAVKHIKMLIEKHHPAVAPLAIPPHVDAECIRMVDGSSTAAAPEDHAGAAPKGIRELLPCSSTSHQAAAAVEVPRQPVEPAAAAGVVAGQVDGVTAPAAARSPRVAGAAAGDVVAGALKQT